MRKIMIYGNEFEWQISQDEYNIWDNQDDNQKENKKYLFATYCIKDGKIMGMFDMFVKDNVLENAKKRPTYERSLYF